MSGMKDFPDGRFTFVNSMLSSPFVGSVRGDTELGIVRNRSTMNLLNSPPRRRVLIEEISDEFQSSDGSSGEGSSPELQAVRDFLGALRTQSGRLPCLSPPTHRSAFIQDRRG